MKLTVIASLSSASPLIADSLLLSRDLKDDVCGSESADHVASDDRTGDLWNKNKISDWFSTAYEHYLLSITAIWTYPGETHQPDIQSLILNLMGNDGSEKCDEITVVVCSGTGLNWNKCKDHPEATFVWFGQ